MANARSTYGLYIAVAVIAAALSVAARHRTTVDTLVLTSPAMVRAGSTVNLPLTLKTSSKNLSALEWQIDAPPGTAVETTSSVDGKVSQCYKQHCMMYGGMDALPSGVIATLKVHLPDSAAADISIRLHDVLGATSAAASQKLGDTSLILKLQH